MMNNTPVNTTPLQDTLTLVGRVLLSLLFIPAGWGKIAGFAGTVGYIQSKGVPMAEVCAARAIAADRGALTESAREERRNGE